jgi:hypothetical protein
MTEDLQKENLPEEADSNEPVADVRETEELQDSEDSDESEDLDADEVEQELLDAMKSLRRTNKNVEQYLDGLARDVKKSDPEAAQPEAPQEGEQEPPKDSDAPADSTTG